MGKGGKARPAPWRGVLRGTLTALGLYLLGTALLALLIVKGVVLILGALNLAGMWLAVFADVGVAFIAILNATRCLHVEEL